MVVLTALLGDPSLLLLEGVVLVEVVLVEAVLVVLPLAVVTEDVIKVLAEVGVLVLKMVAEVGVLVLEIVAVVARVPAPGGWMSSGGHPVLQGSILQHPLNWLTLQT